MPEVRVHTYPSNEAEWLWTNLRHGTIMHPIKARHLVPYTSRCVKAHNSREHAESLACIPFYTNRARFGGSKA